MNITGGTSVCLAIHSFSPFIHLFHLFSRLSFLHLTELKVSSSLHFAKMNDQFPSFTSPVGRLWLIYSFAETFYLLDATFKYLFVHVSNFPVKLPLDLDLYPATWLINSFGCLKGLPNWTRPPILSQSHLVPVTFAQNWVDTISGSVVHPPILMHTRPSCSQ